MVFTAQKLQENRKQHQDLFVAFINLSKAFDTVNREFLWNILLKFGCPKKFVNILRQFHEGMRSHVTIGGQESDPFKVRTGDRQGCVLAPVLFNIFLLCVTLFLHERIQRDRGVTVDFRLDGNLFNIRRLQAVTKVTSEKVIEMQYAYDICAVVAHIPRALQATLAAIASAYGRLGISVNVAKTEVIWHPLAHLIHQLSPSPICHLQQWTPSNTCAVFSLTTAASTESLRPSISDAYNASWVYHGRTESPTLKYSAKLTTAVWRP